MSANPFDRGHLYDRLDGWKQIAEFCGVSASTARVLSQSGLDPLPCFRLGNRRAGRVYAYKSELKKWMGRQ
jgi:hypothetical protein